jgi:hypothetical protein
MLPLVCVFWGAILTEKQLFQAYTRQGFYLKIDVFFGELGGACRHFVSP